MLGASSICKEDKTEIEVSYEGGSGDYDLILYKDDIEVSRESGISGGASPYTFVNINAAGDYSIGIVSLLLKGFGYGLLIEKSFAWIISLESSWTRFISIPFKKGPAYS